MKKVSLKWIVILPVMIFIIFMIIVINVLLNSNLRQIADYNSQKIINSISEEVDTQLTSYLDLAYFASMQFAFFVGNQKLYLPEKTRSLEKFMRDNYKKVLFNVKQIGYSAVGTEKTDYIGYRKEDDNTLTLMVQDRYSDGKLIIYNGESRSDEKIITIDDYDPRIRPWYKVALNQAKTVWSDMYTDYDENQAITITASSPIFDNEEFKGVVGFDVKLNTLYGFIKNIADKNNAVIYITDFNDLLISTSENVSVLSDGTDGLKKGERISAANSSCDIISGIAVNFADKDNLTMQRISLSDDIANHYYVKRFSFVEQGGINWFVYIGVPEDNLIGETKRFYIHTQFIIIGILIIVFLVILFSLTIISNRIKKISENAMRISQGDLNYSLNENSLSREFYILCVSFNKMTKFLLDARNDLEHKVIERTKQLKETQYKLFQSEKISLTTKLVAGVAHEINTPVGVAITSVSYLDNHVETIKNKVNNNQLSQSEFNGFLETAEQSIKLITSNLVRAADLIKIFKNLSVDKINQENQSFDIKEYIETIMKSLYFEFRNTSHTYNVEVKSCMVNSYPDALTQIIVNLITNSLQHAFNDKKSGLVTIRGFKDGENYMLIYEDNGCGLSEDVKKRIFEPFFTSKRIDGRVGLGMSIVSNLVHEKLHGDIIVETKEGEFTRFIIILPIT